MVPLQKPHRPALAHLVIGGFLGPQTDIKVVYYIFPMQQQAAWRDLVPLLADQAGFLQDLAGHGLVGGFAVVNVSGRHFQGGAAERRPVLLDQDDTPPGSRTNAITPLGRTRQ